VADEADAGLAYGPDILGREAEMQRLRERDEDLLDARDREDREREMEAREWR
jgi:hypothetical protein